MVDPQIYNKIKELKNDLVKATSTILFFHTCFKGAKRLEAQMKDGIMIVYTRSTDLKGYLQNVT